MIEWDSHNHMILTWIRNTSIPSISNLLGSFDDAKSAWDMLAKRYSTTHGSMKYQLVVELHQLRQEPGQSINDYYEQFRFIWDQIDLSDPTWACSKDAQQYASIRDEFRLYEFLMSLHKDFEPIRGRLLNRSPAPFLDTVVNELVREEARLATLQAQNKLNVLAITPAPPIEQLSNQVIPLALAIVASRPTKSSVTIASVMATPLRFVIVVTNLLLLLLILSPLRRWLPFQLSSSLLDPLSTSLPLNYRRS